MANDNHWSPRTDQLSVECLAVNGIVICLFAKSIVVSLSSKPTSFLLLSVCHMCLQHLLHKKKKLISVSDQYREFLIMQEIHVTIVKTSIQVKFIGWGSSTMGTNWSISVLTAGIIMTNLRLHMHNKRSLNNGKNSSEWEFCLLWAALEFASAVSTTDKTRLTMCNLLLN